MPTQQQIESAMKAGYTPQQIKLAMARAGAKAPQKKTMAGFLGNVGKSAIDTVGGIGSSLINTINPDLDKNTIANLGRLILGVTEKVIPGKQYHEKYADAVGKFYLDRYGSVDKIMNTIYNDPVGVALDASIILDAGASAVGKIGEVGKIGSLAKAGRIGKDIAEVVDPLRFTSKLAGKGISKVANKLAPEIKSVGENMAFSGLHDPKIQKNIRAISGKTPLELSQQYNTWSRTPESAQKAIESIDELRKAKLVGKSLDVRDIMKDIDANIQKLAGDISDNAQLQRDYLLRKKSDIAGALVQQVNGSSFTPLQQSADNIVKLRQQIGKDIPSNKWAVGASDSAKGEAAKSVYHTFKDRINTLDPTLKQAGRDESALISMKQLFENEQSRKLSRNAVGLGDMILSGAGLASGNIVPAMGALAVKHVLSTPKAVEVASKGFSGIGKALPNINIPSNVRNISNGAYQVGKIGSMVNEPSHGSVQQFPKLDQQPMQVKVQSSPNIIPQTPNPTYNPKQMVIKQPKNVFKNNAAFGKVKKLKMGSFN